MIHDMVVAVGVERRGSIMFASFDPVTLGLVLVSPVIGHFVGVAIARAAAKHSRQSGNVNPQATSASAIAIESACWAPSSTLWRFCRVVKFHQCAPAFSFFAGTLGLACAASGNRLLHGAIFTWLL